MISQMLARYGHRGSWLMVIGSIWCIIGIQAMATPQESRAWVLLDYAPTGAVAAGWITTGAVAFFAGIRSRTGDDSVGHVALYVLPALKVLSFLVSASAYVTTWTLSSLGADVAIVGWWPQSLTALLLWSVVSVMLGLVAAWPNPTPALFPPTREG